MSVLVVLGGRSAQSNFNSLESLVNFLCMLCICRRHLQKSGISGNAGFQQIPSTYTYVYEKSVYN